MKTYHRSISCSVHGLLYSWSRTEWSKEEKAMQEKRYEQAIRLPKEAYEKVVAECRDDRLKSLRTNHWRRELAVAAYNLETARNIAAPLKDDPPQTADWNQLFTRLREHQSCGIVFVED